MKKFNYQITIEAPGKEIADFIMKLICNENEGLITDAKAEKTPEEKNLDKEKMKETALKGILDFEKMIHIIKCCVEDETLVDRLAQMLGFNKPKRQTQP